MINLEFFGKAEESANASLDFFINRPILKMIIWFMRISCIMLAFGFCISLYNHTTKVQDWVSLTFAMIWLFAYKKINSWLIVNNLKKVNFNAAKIVYKIDQKSIFFNQSQRQPIDISWKKLKFVLQNKDGYIIPLTGFTNGGRFLWLPHRAFPNKELESDFLNLVSLYKLKIKKILK